MLRPLAGGQEELEVSGSTVREAVDQIAGQYPELVSRLVEGGHLRGNVTVAIDGEVSTLGLLDSIEEDSELHFIPAISGGQRGTHELPMG